MEALRNLLLRDASSFLEPFVQVLPFVLARLESTSSELRHGAASALTGYAYILLSCDFPVPEGLRDSIRSHVGAFVDLCHMRAKSSSQSQPQLSTLIVSALESNCQQTVGRGPSWACVVLASLVILSDRQCFTHTRTIRLIVRSLAHSKRHQQRSVRVLHAWVWRCLVWAIGRIRSTDPVPNFLKGGIADVRISACKIVQQEHRYGVGMALAAYLLSLPSGDALFGDQLLSSTVLAVAKRMVEDEDEIVHAEGKSVLLRLVSAIGTTTIQSSTTSIIINECGCPEDTLVKELLDGTVLRADEEHLLTIIATTGKLDVTCIRQYAEVEIVQHWGSLLEIWLSCVRRSASKTSLYNPLDVSPDMSLTYTLLKVAYRAIYCMYGKPFCSYKLS